jgi:hypothetical protein
MMSVFLLEFPLSFLSKTIFVGFPLLFNMPMCYLFLNPV